MDVLRIANCSGLLGDRMSALAEVVNDGPVDVVTGDCLAELTMLRRYQFRLKNPARGWATTVLRRLEPVLGTVAERGTQVVVNAGGGDAVPYDVYWPALVPAERPTSTLLP